MKFTNIFTVLSSVSVFAVGLIGNSNPASAARFAEGTFNISGGTVEIESFGTISDATGGAIDSDFPFTDFDFFNLDGSNSPGTGQFTVGGGSGDFAPFLSSGTPPQVQSGTIQDLDLGELIGVATGQVPINGFLDFTFQNSGNTFDLLDLDDQATFDQTDVGVTISIGGTGIFRLVDQVQNGEVVEFLPTPGDITFGTEITFNSLSSGTTPPTDINSVADLTAFLTVPGNEVTGISWSGEASLNPADIPESSNLVALLGLGLIGGTLMIRKGKHQTN